MAPRLYTEWDEETIIMFLKGVVIKSNPRTPKNTKTKWSDDELAVRRWYILDLFKRGMSKVKVNHYLQDKLEISYCTSRRYIDDAMNYLTEDSEDTIEHYRAIARERLENMIERCIATNNMKSALGASEQLNKINGLYIERKEIKGDASIAFEFGE